MSQNQEKRQGRIWLIPGVEYLLYCWRASTFRLLIFQSSLVFAQQNYAGDDDKDDRTNSGKNYSKK